MIGEEPVVWVTRSAASKSMPGWLDPTADQIDDARSILAGAVDDEYKARWALDYIGARIKRISAGDFDHNDLRRAIAMYRAYEEVR